MKIVMDDGVELDLSDEMVVGLLLLRCPTCGEWMKTNLSAPEPARLSLDPPK